MPDPVTPDTDGQTVEYAVRCARKRRINAHVNSPYEDRRTADSDVYWLDKEGESCGPHRVVSRSVSAWVDTE